MTQMQFVIDGVDWQGERPADTPTFLSSPHGYLVASISGAQVSYGAEHLVGTRRAGQTIYYVLRDPAAVMVLDTLCEIYKPTTKAIKRKR